MTQEEEPEPLEEETKSTTTDITRKEKEKEGNKNPDHEEKNVALWRGNWNFYWLLASVLSVYFVFGKGLVILVSDVIRPWYFIHLLAVLLVSLGW